MWRGAQHLSAANRNLCGWVRLFVPRTCSFALPTFVTLGLILPCAQARIGVRLPSTFCSLSWYGHDRLQHRNVKPGPHFLFNLFVRRDTRVLGAPGYVAHFRAAILKPLCASAVLDVFFQISSQPGVRHKQPAPGRAADCVCAGAFTRGKCLSEQANFRYKSLSVRLRRLFNAS